MKFKTNKLSLKVVIASALLAASLPALAVTGDTEQPIHIESDTQSLDMQGNVVTFTGNVVMTRAPSKSTPTKWSLPVRAASRAKRLSMVMATRPPSTRCRTTASR